jgi:uncharacterized membrane protein YhaH (DUF805 family)
VTYYLRAFKKYAVFSGRATRSELWFFMLFNLLAILVLNGISLAIWGSPETAPLFVPGNIYVAAALLPAISLQVRRLHDLGLSGFWWLVIFVPLLGPLALLVIFCLDSQPGPNRFGPNLKAVNAPELRASPVSLAA